ncbi:TetR/AcrR family transcriptional regulator [Candidatus Contubernalis alkaliaceticus]|uniref:TetR/AcrR family transcriptional regulator n=1 Tax=Candidatus Contubernalis alkaliaceticus TaxID=338645 RepID=UPI001F4C3AF7|nr:TetR family transcriptional regulator [Candidatus Contubernalis alkalaceticus]UNC92318.1 TetR/AcrR family transcriptional regulator [Candidatus Contubernalis alkalaceticus]
MPPKTKFEKEVIVEAGLEIAKEKGFSGITARSVANRLRSSVAPIYVNFATIDDLIEAVVQRVFAISEELLAKQKGQSVFEIIGKASLAFARDYPVLFRELSIQPNPYMSSYETIENNMIEAMAEDEAMRGWTIEERKWLLLKMRVFQMGLSVMVANGHVPSWLENQDFENLLMEVGDDLLQVQQLKRRGKLS